LHKSGNLAEDDFHQNVQVELTELLMKFAQWGGGGRISRLHPGSESAV